jgi:phospholipid transport system substrate-binding protein
MQNKSRFIRRIIISVLSVFIVTQIINAVAATKVVGSDPAPLAMVKVTAARMTAEFDKNLGNLKGNTQLVSRIVKTILVPRVDLTAMSQMVLGRYWTQAPGAMQQRFMHEFTDYVIKTYAAALSSYDGEVIKFSPMRGYAAGQSKAQINSQIFHKSGSPIDVQYRVLNKGGSWFIYDFSIEGVSMVENYRAQFASALHKGGLTYLVQELEKR